MYVHSAAATDLLSSKLWIKVSSVYLAVQDTYWMVDNEDGEN
jgi:hypothetical protein